MMEMLYHALVLGVSRWQAPSGKARGGKIYMLERNSGFNSNLVGFELITANMSYDMFDQFQDKRLPAFYEALVSIERGAGGNDTEIFRAVRGQGEISKARLLDFFGIALAPGPSKPSGPPPVPEPNLVRGLAVSATRYDMEEDGGNKGGSIYFFQPSTGRNSNLSGFEVFKARIPYDLFDVLAQLGLPGEYWFYSRITRRGGDKPAVFITGVQSDNLLTAERLETFFLLGGPPPAALPVSSPASGPASSPAPKAP